MSEKRVKINRGVKRLLENLTFNSGIDDKDIAFIDKYPKALDKHINAKRELFRKYPDLMKLAYCKGAKFNE